MKEKKQKDPRKKKTARIVVGSIFGVFALFVLTVVMITVIGNKALIKRAKSYDPAVIENQLVPEKDENGYWTFTTDRDLKVMQLTDIHIGGGWLSLKQDAQALNAVATMIQAEKPDLVVVTGDMAFPVFFKAGTFNNLLSAKEFAALMERLGVYWTVAFGNHDSEIYSYYSREKVADFYGSPEFKYCLFQKGPDDVDGYGNQIINVKNSKGLLTQSIYIFDSHSYTDGDYFGIMWKYDNIHDNQIEWYRDNVNLMNKQNNARLKELGMPEDSDVKSIAFLHIPLPEQRTAWYEYMANGFKDTEDVKYVYGKAGEGKKIIYCGQRQDNLFKTMQELGSTKGIFYGHDHDNNFSIYYKGIRMTYSYSVDYLAYSGINKRGSQRGCTIITLSPDGTFDCKAENYYQDKYQGQFGKEEVTMQEVTEASTHL